MEIRDLKVIKWNLMADREDIEEDIGAKKILLRHYDGQIRIKEKQIGLPSKY
jgi:hypothetical protein